MNRPKRNLMLLAVTALAMFVCDDVLAEKAPMSKEKLENAATHIVIGKVGAIYSRKEQKGDYEYTRFVAEVKIDKQEKGKELSGLVYVRFFDIGWKGAGSMPPGPGGHRPRPRTGGVYRFYLAQNAYDGFTRHNNDGGFNVIYGNGAQPINAAPKNKEPAGDE